jgi:hypothetical protein
LLWNVLEVFRDVGEGEDVDAVVGQLAWLFREEDERFGARWSEGRKCVKARFRLKAANRDEGDL